MAKSHAEGQLEIPWSGITMKGCPAWRVVLARGPTHVLRSHVSQHQSSSHVLHHVHNSEVDFVFSCPKCTATRSIANCSLLVKSGWGHLFCKACRITTRSMTWSCVCAAPWHTCPVQSLLIRRRSNEPVDAASALEQLVPA